MCLFHYDLSHFQLFTINLLKTYINFFFFKIQNYIIVCGLISRFNKSFCLNFFLDTSIVGSKEI